MQHSWGPSVPGRLFTKSGNWKFILSESQFHILAKSNKFDGDVLSLEKLQVVPGIFWASIRLPLPNGQQLSLGGMPKKPAMEMADVIAQVVKKIKISALIANFAQALAPVRNWVKQTNEACKSQIRSKGWISRELIDSINSLKPQGLESLLSESDVLKYLDTEPQETKDAVSVWKRNFADIADSVNSRQFAKELIDSKDYFDTVEKAPLSEEQAKAVVCFDNRVLVVASAGSGKTSTMVAKAGYALKKGYFSADKMLLLAFNNDAAAELRERIKSRLGFLGTGVEKIVAKTFHAFGLEIIGIATGKRPSIPSWLENGRDLETILSLVDDLKDQDEEFRNNWDLFRIVLSQDLPEFGREAESPDAWDRTTGLQGFWTLHGEVVRSRGEQLIANWLFYNGVEYEYEPSYIIDTSDAHHRQYRPDFYFPAIDVYLEHWAVDENGEPPPEFEGYKEGMAWKRQLHAANHTELLETTMASLWSGHALRYLATELRKRGVTLDPNPDRPIPGRKPIENRRLARTFRSFLTHVKSNRLTVNELRSRLQDGIAGTFRFRHQVFLDLFDKIWGSWEAKLRDEKCIDFEDMLGLATNCIESGQWKSPYELIMVDEFQDASQSRARLVASLVNGLGKYLFAVGDDWQSINRFAGSDLAVMTDFESAFGNSVTLKLENTYRCPQSLCDISSEFVQKNPKQIPKMVRSIKKDIVNPLRIIQVDEEDDIRKAVAKRIQEIASATPASDGPIRIYILGRYNKEIEYLPPRSGSNRVAIEFITVHSSKGLEADHVILPRMTAETLGFPSRMVDDPVLQLAMPSGDSYADAEERRLFYVALTRSRSTVTLITLTNRYSPFITELIKEHALKVSNLDGEVAPVEACPNPKCDGGILVQRKGKYGFFLGCNRFPRCNYTRNLAPERHHAEQIRRR